MNKFLTLKIYRNRIEAGTDKTFLGTHNIQGIISSDDAGGSYPFPFSPSPKGVELRVREEDFENAKRLLRESVIL